MKSTTKPSVEAFKKARTMGDAKGGVGRDLARKGELRARVVRPSDLASGFPCSPLLVFHAGHGKLLE